MTWNEFWIEFLRGLPNWLAAATGLGALAVTYWGIRSALFEHLRQFRAVRVEQRQAEVAEAFFSSAVHYARALNWRVVGRAIQLAHKTHAWRDPKIDLEAAGTVLDESWRLAEMYGIKAAVGSDLTDTLTDLAAPTSELVDELDQRRHGGGMTADLLERVRGHVDAVDAELVRIANLLRPVVMHSLAVPVSFELNADTFDRLSIPATLTEVPKGPGV